MPRAPLPLWVVLLGSLVVRLAWAIHQPTGAAALAALPDQAEYLQIGSNLLHGQGLQMTDPRIGQRVLAWRTPGYPLFIALCDARPMLIRCAQALLGTLSVGLVYGIARKWLSVGASVIAAAIVAIDPFLIYYSGLLLSETLFIALMIGAMWCWIRWQGRGRWLAGGVLMGMATLVRPSALMLGPLLAFLIAGQVIGEAGGALNPLPGLAYHWRGRWAAAAAALICTAIVCFPWALRNRLVLGQWIWSSTNDGITLYDGFHPGATGESDQRFLQPLFPRVQSMSEVQRSAYFKDLAHEFVREHPLEALRLGLVKIARTWSPLPLSEQFGSRPLYVAAGLAFALPLFLLAILGVVSGGRGGGEVRGIALGRQAKWILLAPAAYFTLVHAASVGSLRYRAPAEPPLAILAAAGAMVVFNKRYPTSRGRSSGGARADH